MTAESLLAAIAVIVGTPGVAAKMGWVLVAGMVVGYTTRPRHAINLMAGSSVMTSVFGLWIFLSVETPETIFSPWIVFATVTATLFAAMAIGDWLYAESRKSINAAKIQMVVLLQQVLSEE